MSKLRSPCCQHKTTQGRGGLLRCGKCGGAFDPREIASGCVEGGDYGRRPDERLMREESGTVDARPVRTGRKLKGGIG